MEEERLQKYLAECGVASRRKCEEFIEMGRVFVNGNKVTEELFAQNNPLINVNYYLRDLLKIFFLSFPFFFFLMLQEFIQHVKESLQKCLESSFYYDILWWG